MHTCDHTWTNEDGTRDVDLEIDYQVAPLRPATHDRPAEGGVPVLDEIRCVEIRLYWENDEAPLLWAIFGDSGLLLTEDMRNSAVCAFHVAHEPEEVAEICREHRERMQ